MKLEKAIKILSEDLIPNYPYAVGEKARAIQLGIEGMKYLECLREDCAFIRQIKLPGETEE